jgi:hypothetical protein
MFNNSFLPKIMPCVTWWWKMWYSQTVHRWKHNTTHAHFMLDNQGYRHTLRIRNTYCFSTATVVTRTRLFLSLYVLSRSYSTGVYYSFFLTGCRRTMSVWRSHRGLQCGLPVILRSHRGLQCGLSVILRRHRGLQCGLSVILRSHRGLQCGLSVIFLYLNVSVGTWRD